jgi:mannose-1-phosphate guanylyltransferase/mannose-6-phosphate isomerase
MKFLILAGGSGTRLWPRSRELFPKQFIAFQNDETLLQSTIKRALDVVSPEDIFVVMSDHLYDLTLNETSQFSIPAENLIIEPCARNTMPAITFSVKWLAEKTSLEQKEPICVVPADAWIDYERASWKGDISEAHNLAEQGYIVTFGIPPTSPDTGYGYISADKEQPIGNTYKALSFVEKPDVANAEKFLKAGNYYWNAGMFVFSLETFSSEAEKYAPEFYSYLSPECTSAEKAFYDLPRSPIDKALMEKSSLITVKPFSLQWSDVGCWERVHETFSKDENNNVSSGDVVLHNTRNSLIHSESRLVTALDVEDLVIVETEDAVLVAKKGSSQESIKAVHSSLAREKRKELSSFSTSYRPWGNYKTITKEEGHQVKKITILLGKRLSLQLHRHRDEHWTIVKGKACVTVGEEDSVFYENQSLFIPREQKHRIENIGTEPLEFIEVQYGEYLEEDDIERFEDDFGRVKQEENAAVLV